MTSEPTRPGGPMPNRGIAFGLLQIGLGKSAGFTQFGNSPQAFLNSLSPLLGCLIVAGAGFAWYGRPLLGLRFFFSTLCGLLAPAVIADLLCRRWERIDRWTQYANVLNCSQWLMAAALLILIPISALCVSAGFSAEVASGAMLIVFAVYVIWLYWFSALHVLDLSAGKAVLVTMAVLFGTALLVHLPGALATAFTDSATPRPIAPPPK